MMKCIVDADDELLVMEEQCQGTIEKMNKRLNNVNARFLEARIGRKHEDE